MNDAAGRLILFARAPRLGEVKTRLQPDLSAEEALSLHRAMLQDAADLVRGFTLREGLHAEISLSAPALPGDGTVAHLEGVEVTVQQGDDLGERLVRAFQTSFRRGERRVAVMGSDSPTLDAEYLRTAFDGLRDHEVVVGPAEDGGYILIGCSRLHVRPFQRIPWGTERVLAETLRRLRREKIPFLRLRPGHDLDTRDDLLRIYRELEHLAAVGAPAPAPRTLTALRELVRPRPDWLI